MVPFGLEKFNDIHKGRMAFVVGSGPSLRHITSEQKHEISKHVVIAVNGAILAFPHADYFFSCDGRVTLTKAWQSLKDVECKLLLDETYCGFNTYDHLLKINAYKEIDSGRLHSFQRSRDMSSYRVAKSELLLHGSCSAHPAVHFAHICGCAPIVLLGMDCRLEEGKKRFTEFDDQPDDGLFNPEWSEAINADGDGVMNNFAYDWQRMSRENPGLPVINCSYGSRWEGFEKKPLGEVLNSYA